MLAGPEGGEKFSQIKRDGKNVRGFRSAYLNFELIDMDLISGSDDAFYTSTTKHPKDIKELIKQCRDYFRIRTTYKHIDVNL